MRYLILVVVLFASFSVRGQQPENWTPAQLMAPADLAKRFDNEASLPLLICVGPGAYIPHSIHTGMAKDSGHLDSLRRVLKNVSKDQEVVIYCGCCPYDHCPNVRPAIRVLKEMKFTHYYLLDLPKNIKTDWIDKGYPVVK